VAVLLTVCVWIVGAAWNVRAIASAFYILAFKVAFAICCVRSAIVAARAMDTCIVFGASLTLIDRIGIVDHIDRSCLHTIVHQLCVTCSTVEWLLCCKINARMPATPGAAMEVPCNDL